MNTKDTTKPMSKGFYSVNQLRQEYGLEPLPDAAANEKIVPLFAESVKKLNGATNET